MLVISRKIGESLLVSDNIKITVIAAGNDKVTIGIDAPKDIKVIREELYEIIESNKISAQKPSINNMNEIANFIKNSKHR
ncbi:MAG: carbon storage regulator CsrA [Eubacteriales bacterium]|nr:carbon storage regulator CsrA [Eubacteriales bacterium]